MSLKWKRHHRLVGLLALLSAVLIGGLGSQGIVAYSLPAQGQTVAQAASTLAALFAH